MFTATFQGISTGIAKLDRKKNSSETNENYFFIYF